MLYATIMDTMFRSVSSFSVALALLIVGVCGGVTSMLLTTDRRWMEWHLSRLGEGGHVSSLIFNLTLILCAACLTAIGSLLRQEFDAIKQINTGRLIQSYLYAAAFCWVGVGVFPFDQFPVVHNIFGYGELVILGVLMIMLVRKPHYIDIQTRLLAILGVVITGGMMIMFHATHFTTLLVVELVGQAFFFAWLLSLTRLAATFRTKAVIGTD